VAKRRAGHLPAELCMPLESFGVRLFLVHDEHPDHAASFVEAARC
jgi:hypothetical protein